MAFRLPTLPLIVAPQIDVVVGPSASGGQKDVSFPAAAPSHKPDGRADRRLVTVTLLTVDVLHVTPKLHLLQL